MRVRVCVYARVRAHAGLVREKISEQGGSADGKSRTCSHGISFQRVWGGERLRERIVQSPQVLPPGTSDGDDDSDVPRRATGRAEMLMRLSEKSPSA